MYSMSLFPSYRLSLSIRKHNIHVYLQFRFLRPDEWIIYVCSHIFQGLMHAIKQMQSLQVDY